MHGFYLLYLKLLLGTTICYSVKAIRVPSDDVNGSEPVSLAVIESNGTVKPIDAHIRDLESAIDGITSSFRVLSGQTVDKTILQNGDVIHVIEPPQSFEDLKKRMRSQSDPTKFNLLETVPEKRPHQPPPLLPTPSVKLSPNNQHKPHQYPSNVSDAVDSFGNLPKRQRRRPLFLPSLAPPAVSLLPRKRVKKTLDENDLNVAESHRMPMGILTSVRKTKRLIKKSKPKFKKAKQRIISRKFNTVIWEKGQERKQIEKGQEKRVTGIREHFGKAKSSNAMHNKIGSAGSQPQPFYSYRSKRSVANSDDHLPFIFNKPLSGEELLQHINGLLENATFYLSTIEDVENEPPLSKTMMMSRPGRLDNRLAASTVSAARVTTLTVNKTNYTKPQSRITIASNNSPNNSGVYEAEQQILHTSLRAVDNLVDFLRTRTNSTTIAPPFGKVTLTVTTKAPAITFKTVAPSSSTSPRAKGSEDRFKVKIPFHNEKNSTNFFKMRKFLTSTTTTETITTTRNATAPLMEQFYTLAPTKTLSLYPKATLISSVIRKVVPKSVARYRNQTKTIQRARNDEEERTEINQHTLKPRRSKVLRRNPYAHAQLANDYLQDQKAVPVPINGSLIYDDVMTTIRNMLHSKYIYELNNVLPDNMTDGIENILLLGKNQQDEI